MSGMRKRNGYNNIIMKEVTLEITIYETCLIHDWQKDKKRYLQK